MAVLVISGSGRGAGKTAVACALIAAMPQFRWLALKATPHGHDHLENTFEELDPSSEKDTGRYLAAGARRAFLLTESPEPLPTRITRLRAESPELDAVVIESNQVSPFQITNTGEKSVTLALLADSPARWKSSVWRSLERADAWLVPAVESLQPELVSFLANRNHVPVFSLEPGNWLSQETLNFVLAITTRK